MNISTIIEEYVEKFGNPAKIEGMKRVEGKYFLQEKFSALLEEIETEIMVKHGTKGSMSGTLGYTEKIRTGGDIARDSILAIIEAKK